jgi:hypothetical protein
MKTIQLVVVAVIALTSQAQAQVKDTPQTRLRACESRVALNAIVLNPAQSMELSDEIANSILQNVVNPKNELGRAVYTYCLSLEKIRK